MLRKRVLSILLVLVSLTPLFSSAVSLEYMQRALLAVGGATVSTIASSTSIPAIALDGVTVEKYVTEDNTSAATLSYLRSDLYRMARTLENPSPSGRSFFERFLYSATSSLSPFTRIAVSLVDSMEIGPSDVILDGTLRFTGTDLGTSLLQTFFAVYVMRDYDVVDFTVDVSVVVSGSAFRQPVAFEGSIIVKGDSNEKCVTLTAENMTCNNLEIEISPMVLRVTQEDS